MRKFIIKATEIQKGFIELVAKNEQKALEYIADHPSEINWNKIDTDFTDIKEIECSDDDVIEYMENKILEIKNKRKSYHTKNDIKKSKEEIRILREKIEGMKIVKEL